MSVFPLSEGILNDIIRHSRLSESPSLQIVQIKELTGKPGMTKRFRVALNDGRHFVSGMCSQHMNSEIINQSVKEFNIIRLTKYTVNENSDKKVIIIMDFDVLGSPTAIRDETAVPPQKFLKTDCPRGAFLFRSRIERFERRLSISPKCRLGRTRERPATSSLVRSERQICHRNSWNFFQSRC